MNNSDYNMNCTSKEHWIALLNAAEQGLGFSKGFRVSAAHTQPNTYVNVHMVMFFTILLDSSFDYICTIVQVFTCGPHH